MNTRRRPAHLLFHMLSLALLSAGAACAAQALPVLPVIDTDKGCEQIPSSRIADLLKVDPGTIRVASIKPQPGHLRCEYTSVERVVGGTDRVAAEFNVDDYNMPNAVRAHQQLDRFGQSSMLVKTADTTGADDAVPMAEEISAANVNREPGFAVRHGVNIVVVTESGSFMQERPADWAYQMQAFALQTAGASVVGHLFKDVCSLIPPAELQTLVTLKPATVVPDPNYAGSLRECDYQVKAGDDTLGRIEIQVSRNANTANEDMDGPDGVRSAVVRTADPNDRILVAAGTHGQASALHGHTRATLKVTDADAYALVSPTYNYRVERIALEAAGASILPNPAMAADPPALAEQPPPPPSFASHFSGDFVLENLGWLILVVVFGGIGLTWFSRVRLRSRLLKDGVPASARIDSVGDTGTTINNQPLVRFTVTITPQVGPAYQATTTKIVSRLVAPASMIGSVQPVMVDRTDPSKFIFTGNF